MSTYDVVDGEIVWEGTFAEMRELVNETAAAMKEATVMVDEQIAMWGSRGPRDRRNFMIGWDKAFELADEFLAGIEAGLQDRLKVDA